MVVAYSSAEAIEAVKTNKPEFIFIDIAMPRMSGYELVAVPRKEPGLQNTKFIALSGFGKEYSQRSLEAGFHEHVIKPASPGELHRILSQTQ